MRESLWNKSFKERILSIPGGQLYIGNFKEGKPFGLGIFKENEVSRLAGDFLDDRAVSRGIAINLKKKKSFQTIQKEMHTIRKNSFIKWKILCR